MKYISYIILSFLFIFSACRKDIDTVDFQSNIPEPTVLVESSLRGKVVRINSAGIPVGMPNALVTVDNNTMMTDEDGRFHFKNIEVKKGNSLVSAESSGYFEGSSFANFRSEGTSFVEITILDKGAPVAFDAAQDATVTLDEDVEISIPKGILRTNNGNTYAGNVNVFSRYLDPTADNIRNIMPGALNATAENGDPLALVSYGMVVFDLETADGQALSIADGQSVQMKIPIPEELQDEAPNEIDLWLFDVEEEQWLLEGKCETDGEYYYADVDKTGTWNCDVGVPAFCLSGQIFNADSTYASYLQVIVEDLSTNFVYWGYTDSTGYFCGSVPQDVDLLLTIVDHCDNKLYCEEIGAFSEDTQLPDIYLEEVLQTYFLNIKGMVSHCLTNDVPDGWFAVEVGDNIRIFPFTAGGFDVDVAFLCIDFPELKITVYSNSQQAASETFIYSTYEDIDLGQVLTCEELPEYIIVTAEGVDYWTSPTWSIYFESQQLIYMDGLSSGGSLYLNIEDYNGVGSYENKALFYSQNKPEPPLLPSFEHSVNNDLVSVNVLVDDGEFIIGDFNGIAIDSDTGNDIPISGTFKVRAPN